MSLSVVWVVLNVIRVVISLDNFCCETGNANKSLARTLGRRNRFNHTVRQVKELCV